MARTRDVLEELAEWYAPAASSAAAWHGASAPRCFSAQPALSLRSTARHACVRVVDALLAWHDRARERLSLAELGDQMLRDIGISRAEASRPRGRPWRI